MSPTLDLIHHSDVVNTGFSENMMTWVVDVLHRRDLLSPDGYLRDLGWKGGRERMGREAYGPSLR